MISIMWAGIALFADAKHRHFGPGDTIFRAEARVMQVFLVRSGRIALVRPLPSGENVILHQHGEGDILAEASVYAERYHCDATALETTVLATVPRFAFKDILRDDPVLAETWAAHLARSVQRARMRAEIRSLKTVSSRLDAWQAEYGALPEKGQWQTLASELSVSREALYRELARRRS